MTGSGAMNDKLHHASVRDKTKKREVFIPIGALREICRRDLVKEQLGQSYPDWSDEELDACARCVCPGQDGAPYSDNSMMKIFAILVLMNEVRKVNHFTDNGIKDIHLPFSLNPSDDGETLIQRRLGHEQHDIRVPGSQEWGKSFTNEFFDKQWQLLAPIFRASSQPVTTELMEPDVVMPWLEKTKNEGCNPGGYSVVYSVKIHPDHHEFEPCGHVALKTLNSSSEDDFDKELANLNRCASKAHLVELYAAMKHGQEYSFLFPWAGGGPLSSLWSRDSLTWFQDDEPADLSVKTVNAVRWLAQQCYGLVSQEGLGFVHNMKSLARTPYMEVLSGDNFGIHGDIKPDNILHFYQRQNDCRPGVLKISDMGLTGFHTLNSRSLQPPTGPCSPTYRAPEHGKRDRFLSRKYDVWSLGCVFSELLSWLILGREGVLEYSSRRFEDIHPEQANIKEDNFFQYILRNGRPEDTILKPSVAEWFRRLRESVGEGNFLHDFLTYIEDKMLEVDEQVRVSCRDVSDFLEAKFRMCHDENHKGYCSPKQLLFHDVRPRRCRRAVPEQGTSDRPSRPGAESAGKRRRLT